MIVVIPCFSEPNLTSSLQSLWDCQRPSVPVEVIVVINSGEQAGLDDLKQNQRTVHQANSWIQNHDDPSFRTHIISAPSLPERHAGVGFARKIGMDEAVRRLAQPEGIIACFDADSVCDPNYLVELERFFAKNRKSPGCSIYFEHPVDGPEGEAITLYELHLRYYVEGLRYASFPHAYHTIGSSMAVRANAYMKQGGMNKRQAGEDFYFLHKIIPLGHFGEINTTRVLPSARISHRVPFGTGKAVGDYLKTGQFCTYPHEAFEDLRNIFAAIEAFYTGVPAEFPASIQSFLAMQNFEKKVAELRSNTSTLEKFRQRFFRWFDGFLVMKFVHFVRDNYYGGADIVEESNRLLRLIGKEGGSDSGELLGIYRNLQKNRASAH